MWTNEVLSSWVCKQMALVLLLQFITFWSSSRLKSLWLVIFPLPLKIWWESVRLTRIGSVSLCLGKLWASAEMNTGAIRKGGGYATWNWGSFLCKMVSVSLHKWSQSKSKRICPQSKPISTLLAVLAENLKTDVNSELPSLSHLGVRPISGTGYQRL